MLKRMAGACLALVLAASGGGGSALAGATTERGRIAFARGGKRPGIYTIDANGRRLERVTRHRDSLPTWSPDGSMLAIRRWNEDPRRYDLVVATPDGSEQRRVGTDLYGPPGREFAWSPDGAAIAYGSRAETSDYRVVVVDLATDETAFIDDAIHPAWSPDGSRIAYAAELPDHPDCGNEIFTAEPNGSDVQRVTHDAFADDGAPVWSPDGVTIAFISTRDHDHAHDPARCDELYGEHEAAEIYSVPADGGEATRLTSIETYKFTPVWSPSGTRIAFASQCSIDRCYQTHPRQDLYVVSADGDHVRNLTKTLHRAEEQPAWSHDGSEIGFTSQRKRPSRVEIISVRTRERRVLVDSPAADMDPHWRP